MHSAVLELLRAARTGRHPKFGSHRALAPRAPPLMTDSLLLALVAQNRWLLLVRQLPRCWSHSAGWSPRSSRAPTASVARPVVSRADSFRSAAGLLTRRQLPTRIRSSRARSSPLCALVARLSLLVVAVCTCCTTQSPGGSSVGLALRWSPPLTPSVTAQSPARANSTGIRLLSTVPHLWSSCFDCPTSSGKEKTKCG